jgi:hypothetical protein
MKEIRRIRIIIIAMLLFFSCGQMASAEQVVLEITTGDGTNEGVQDMFGNWITREAVILAIRAYNGIIHPPGNAPPYYLSGGDTFLESSEVGAGFPPDFNPDLNGRFNFHPESDFAVTKESYIYLRVFNAASIEGSTWYGDSPLIWIDPTWETGSEAARPNLGGTDNTPAFFVNKIFDISPPGPPVSFEAVPEATGNIYLSWTNTNEAGLASIEVWYKTSGGFPTKEADGSRAILKPALSGEADSYTHTNRVNGTTYYYSIFSIDQADNYSTGYATASAISLDTISPEVISASPRGGDITIFSPTIRVYFSEAMSRESVQDALSIWPTTSRSFTWTANSRTVEVNPGTLLNSTTYTVSVGAGAKDVHGNSLDPTPEAYPNAYTFSFTTAAAPPDIVSPTISNILLDGRRALANDVVSSTPKLSALISDEVALSQIASIEVLANGVQKYYGSPGIAFNTTTGTFETPISLGEGSYTLTFRVWDLSGNPTEESLTIRVFGDEVGVVGPVLNYPNPFSPARGVGTSIAYTLKSDFEVTLYIYDIGAHLVFKKSYPQGGEGGRAGYNEVYWNGKNVYGEYVPNGIFVVKLVGEGKVLKTSKITVID